MAGKLSPTAQRKLNEVREFLEQVQRVHGLVELYATVRSDHQQYEAPIRRAFEQLRATFMGAGFEALSQLCGSMAVAARRVGSRQSRSRILRDGVGSLRFQLDLEQRAIIANDEAAQKREEERKES